MLSILRLTALLATRLGKSGGVFLILVGVGCAGAGGWLVVDAWPLGDGLRTGLVLLGTAPVLFAFGVLLRVTGQRDRTGPASDSALRALLEGAAPLRLCLDCRLEVAAVRCRNCGHSVSCFDVRTEADRVNALALLGLS